MNYSIEAQAEALYLFNMNANIKETDYPVDQDLWDFYIKCKELAPMKSTTLVSLIESFNLLKRQPNKEFNDSVILCYSRNILLYKLTTLYQDLFSDNELLENLK